MSKRPRNRHDAFFRGVFSMRSIVLIYLQKFLPPGLLRLLDFTTLQKADDSFVSGRLLASFSDVVWVCNSLGGRALRICFIFEHKSSHSKLPIFVQLLQYMLNVWKSDIRQKRPLTLPIPIVIYHGKEPWDERIFADWFDGITPEESAFVPVFQYILTDLERIKKEQLEAMKLEQLFHVFLAMKFVFHTPELVQYAREILNFADEYLDSEEGKELFEMVMTYYESYTPIEAAELAEIVEELRPQPKSFAMSTYNKIKKLGRIEGKLEGKLEEAAIKDRQFVTSLILNTDFDDAKIALLAAVSEEFVQQVRSEISKAN